MMYRAGSVPPGLYRSTSMTSVASTPSRLPSYCPPHGHYYGFTPVSSYIRPVSTTSSNASRIYSRSSPLVPKTPSHAYTSTRHFDMVYPSRQFGTRLSKGYTATMARPEIYEQVYGVSYLPGYGRDSFSAYKIADATIDDSDDMISRSYKRDNQVLRDVERTIADISNLPPVTRSSHFVRASSVPPQLHHTPMIKSSKMSRITRGAVPSVKVRRTADDVYYKVPPPKVQYHYETVNKGSELLSAKEKMFAKECIDLTSPSATLALKMRIQNAQNSLQKHGDLIGKYYAGDSKDDMEVEAELRRIKTTRAMRAKSVV